MPKIKQKVGDDARTINVYRQRERIRGRELELESAGGKNQTKNTKYLKMKRSVVNELCEK